MKQFKQILVKLTLALALVVPIAVQANSHQAQAASVTTKRNKVVKLAKKQVGKRYVYGATGPNAFDCSGLTSYVYSHAIGKYISRTTYSQVYQGKAVKVSTASLKKGDLLFWGSKSSPYHVGIYVGGGQYVHAATPSQGVRKQYLSSYFWPSTAKRVI
ncbi:C40 family peptidase [Lactobacillus delbrueckii]|uniref:C40 family peptidase n=1 Tax=Lactobacillus delbrueckii TaxID=1584 RepID=UPI0025A2A0AE|nr:C40 family peptidase [Lactobacillus delbrueckii]MDM7512263.1 C40 family peptidase [Lactobacillus delbrueckii]